MNTGTTIKIYSAFEDAKEVWLTFEKEGLCHGFQSYKWLYRWHKAIGAGFNITLCMVSVHSRDNQPLIFFPLGIKRNTACRHLIWLGDELADYQTPLLSNDFYSHIENRKSFEILWESVLQKLPEFDLIHFRNMPEKAGMQQNPFLHLDVQPSGENSYMALLAGDWNSFYSERARRTIKADSKRQIKRLSESGNLEFVIAAGASEIDRITDAMIVQKQQQYKITGVNDPFRKKCYRQFYRQCARELAPEGLVHISALKLDDEIIASHWGMVSGKRFYYLMPAYDRGRWGKYSPGRLLLERLIQWAFEQGIEVFDFTGGGERYKKDWCNHETALYELIQPKTPKGSLYCRARSFKRKLDRHGWFQYIKRFLR